MPNTISGGHSSVPVNVHSQEVAPQMGEVVESIPNVGGKGPSGGGTPEDGPA